METLEKKIKEMNREILRLKTSHPMASGMKTFWAEHTFELEAYVSDPYAPAVYHSYYFEITYIDGAQPILTDWTPLYNSNVWLGMAVLEAPSNNKQILVIWDTGYGNIVELAFNSSRQILGIRRINDPN
jgi:hypothetical protein